LQCHLPYREGFKIIYNIKVILIELVENKGIVVRLHYRGAGGKAV